MTPRVEISIIIPFLNEKEGIQQLLKGINEYYLQRKFEFEIIFVDDGSDDNTSEIIKNVSSFPFPCSLIHFSKNFGSHAAVRAGLLNSNGKYFTFLPADLQVSFITIEDLYNALMEGNDVVFGVREINNIGFIEKIFSRVYAVMMRKYVSQLFPDKGLETFLINEKVRKVINANVESNSSVYLQALTIGFKNKFINIEKSNRVSGRSKWTFSKKIKLLVDSFVAFSFMPIRFVSIIGVCFFFIGLAWSLYAILRKLIYNDLETGWPALLSILLLGFGITNISLGIIAEYLWRTLDASRKRPVYIIDEIVNLNEKNKK